MTSPSRLESLPVELLLEIASSLSQARNDALKWACTRGHLNMIRRLIIDFKSSPSAIEGGGLTLYLALKNNHLDAFQLLLELGARVDVLGKRTRERKAFVERLFSSSTSHSHDFARLFFQAGLATQLLSPDLLNKSLMMLIRRDAPVDLVKLVLDHGACVEKIHRTWEGPRNSKSWTNPLSQSILRGSKPIFDVLLERGAFIHDLEIYGRFPLGTPLHIPIYAATYAMVKHGTAMLQACLDHGADINHPAVIHPRWRRQTDSNMYWCGTPLLGYLDSIRSWPAKSNDPVHHLRYLLDRGAVLPDYLFMLPFIRGPGFPDVPNRYRTPEQTLPFLLERMRGNMDQLADPQFQAVTKLLIQHGALVPSGTHEFIAADRIETLLDHARYHRNRRDPRVPDWGRVSKVVYPTSTVEAWCSFVTLLIDHSPLNPNRTSDIDPVTGYRVTDIDRQETINALLNWYVHHQGVNPFEPPTELTFAIIYVLITRGGADVNAFLWPRDSSVDPWDQIPILHRLCTNYYHKADFLGCDESPDDHAFVLNQWKKLLPVLVEHGADPDLKVYSDARSRKEGRGKTAEDLLLGGWAGREYSRGPRGGNFLKELAKEMRDARAKYLANNASLA